MKTYNKEYYIKNRKRIGKNSSRYYQKNRDERLKYKKGWDIKNPRYNYNWQMSNIRSWVGLIPTKTKCQICKKTLYFGPEKRKKSEYICFDHRHNGNEIISSRPTHWLARHKRTKENEAIWKLCDFGILCSQCNSFLPTKDRKRFLSLVTKYIKDTK